MTREEISRKYWEIVERAVQRVAQEEGLLRVVQRQADATDRRQQAARKRWEKQRERAARRE